MKDHELLWELLIEEMVVKTHLWVHVNWLVTSSSNYKILGCSWFYDLTEKVLFVVCGLTGTIGFPAAREHNKQITSVHLMLLSQYYTV